MKPGVVLLLFLIVAASEAAEQLRLVEEVVLRDGNQQNRQERRFGNREDKNNGGDNLIRYQDVNDGPTLEIEVPLEAAHSGEEIVEDVIIKIKEEEEVERPTYVNKGILVPQLWPNYTGPELPEAETVPCDVARMKCAFRSGCGLALQNYALGCMALVEGKTDKCNSHCRHSLIALMSTPQGQRLMKVNSFNFGVGF